MKTRKSISGVLVIIILLSTIIFCGYSTGITGVTMKPGSSPGCICHGAFPSSNVIVIINGPDSLIINQEAIYTVSITGGPLTAAGTNVTSSSGTLTPVAGSGLKIEFGELTHQSPKFPSGGVVSFQFNFKAPSATGTAVIYANGNSVNFDLNSTGDEWDFAPNKNVTIKDIPAGINGSINISSFKLEQNYPNPFNPSTVIRYSVPLESKVIISFYNSLGQIINEVDAGTRQPGNYEYNFTSAGLASGIYIYSIKAVSADGKNEFVDTKKMIVMK